MTLGSQRPRVAHGRAVWVFLSGRIGTIIGLFCRILLAASCAATSKSSSQGKDMIYYVIPPELEESYFEEFRKRFENVEGVEVILDRRTSERRTDQDHGGQRVLRDRRRRRAPGTFPPV